eukprot:scaffold34822_cov32-Tisochrysis_lutea.AAC.9
MLCSGSLHASWPQHLRKSSSRSCEGARAKAYATCTSASTKLASASSSNRPTSASGSSLAAMSRGASLKSNSPTWTARVVTKVSPSPSHVCSSYATSPPRRGAFGPKAVPSIARTNAATSDTRTPLAQT